MTRPRGDSRLLLTDRETAVLLERSRVQVEGDRVVYYAADDEMRRSYAIPHANIAVLFLGQGTSITQEAARLLAEEGVHLAFTGTGGTPLHLGSLTTYHATRHFREMLPIYLDPGRSLLAAKAVMAARIACMREVGFKLAGRWMKARESTLQAVAATCLRFEKQLPAITSIPELLGQEGQFTKSCYRDFSRLAGFTADGFRRSAGAGGGRTPETLVNSLLDHGNYLCYGIAGAALWTLGIPPHLAVFHGKTRAGGLVFDVADAFKDAFILPIAFCAPGRKAEEDPETAFRARVITAFDDERVLSRALATVEAMLEAGSQPVPA